MKTRMVKVLLVAAMSAALAAPALGAEANVIDLKQVEAQILAAQGQIVRGDLERGVKALRAVQPQAVTAELAARAGFVSALAEVRAVQQLGDPAKVLAALQAAFKAASEPDQVAAVWQVAQGAAQAAAQIRNDAGAKLVDFLSTGPGQAMHQFAPHVQIARLRIATSNAAGAADELRRAAQRARSKADWAEWVRAVGGLAAMADAGQFPRAGMEVYENFRAVARGALAGVLVDLAEGQFLLRRGRLEGPEITAILDRAAKAGVSGDERIALLALTYDFAVASKRAGKAEQADALLARAEDLAKSLAGSAAAAKVRAQALLAFGDADQAAAAALKAAQAVKAGPAQDGLLAVYANAMAALGKGTEATGELAALKAGPAAYVVLAGTLARGGKPGDAMAALAAIPPQAVAGSPRTVGGIAAVMRQIQAQRRQVAGQQVARCRALAAALEEAARKAAAAKDARGAAELNVQAAALKALAGQLEK